MADSTKSQTEFAIVYFHGFSATRQETAPLSDSLAARLGANLFYTRLVGHGRSDDHMGDASINNWLNDAVEALTIGRKLGEKIIIIGMSTGATLATWLAGYDRSKYIYCYVFLSPNFGPNDAKAEVLTWPWATYFARPILGETRTWTARNELQERYWHTSYPTTALFPMMGLVHLAFETDLSQMDTPFLFLFSKEDTVVNPELTEQVYKKIGSSYKQKHYMDASGDGDSHHLFAGNIVAPQNNEKVLEIMMTFLNGFRNNF